MRRNSGSNRRAVLAGALLAAAPLAASPIAAAAQPRGRGKPTTFLLVHGAWHGGWCWDQVSARLTALGHVVIAPTLTGLCERSHLLSPSVNLTTHIDDIAGEIRFKDLSNIVLCGHSYGGMVITGVAERYAERIGSIVYLDAFWPRDGQSLDDITGHASQPGVNPTRLASAFMDPVNAAWANARLTPQPVETFREKLKVTGAVERIPKRTFVQATIGEAPFFAATFERAKASPGWKTLQVNSRHDVMVDQPDQMTKILLDAAPGSRRA
jgi:pimeloyl-ACP methyl ester carboxylesterase